jgi:hypothetical protein
VVVRTNETGVARAGTVGQVTVAHAP